MFRTDEVGVLRGRKTLLRDLFKCFEEIVEVIGPEEVFGLFSFPFVNPTGFVEFLNQKLVSGNNGPDGTVDDTVISGGTQS